MQGVRIQRVTESWEELLLLCRVVNEGWSFKGKFEQRDEGSADLSYRNI